MDNVDHNIRTLDGKDTFHGMGKTLKTRVTMSAEDIAQIDRINNRYFTSACCGIQSFLYEKVLVAASGKISTNIDLLWKISLTVQSTRPSWTGMMQMVNHGEHPGQASVVFLPIIDLNLSDLKCIYSIAFCL